MMPQLTIIRGIPGSGKSTFAKNLGQFVIRVETDTFFVDKDGVYRFRPQLLREAHDWCFDMVSSFLDRGYDVSVANTFTRLWEMQRYLDLPYKHKVFRCMGNYENTHGVPQVKVQEMFDRFEDFEGEILLDK